MLRFADADEAEAVYSIVSLTQAGRQQKAGGTADMQGAVMHVSEATKWAGTTAEQRPWQRLWQLWPAATHSVTLTYGGMQNRRSGMCC